MATFSAQWTENVSLHASAALADAASATDTIDLANLGYYMCDVQLDIDADSGSPNGDVTIEVFGSSDDGTTFDTIPRQKVTLNFTAQRQDILTITVGGARAQVKVTNNVGASITYAAKYAGLKETSV